MDIVSYAKASNAINKIKQTKKELGPNVKKDFSSLDERLDYLEAQVSNRYVEKNIDVIFKEGTFINTELVDGTLQLKTLRKIINNDGLVPAMKSNTTPYGIVRTSSIYSGLHEGYTAFDRIDNGEGWVTKPKNLTGWIEYEFVNKTQINKYTLKAPKSSSYYKEMARDWTLEGFDGKKWIVLDRQTYQSFSANAMKTYTLKTSANYKIYRINITANNGYPSYTGIQEIQFYSGEQNIYVDTGSWESNVIDLEESLLNIKSILSKGTSSIKKEICYSNDGVLFSEYEEVDNENLKNERFIKIKLTLHSNDYVVSGGNEVFSTPSIDILQVSVKRWSLLGYMEKVEAKNERDFVELVFKSDTALDAKKNKMESLVVDVFNEDSVENISTKADIKETVPFIKDLDIAEGFLKSITIDSLENIKGVEV